MYSNGEYLKPISGDMYHYHPYNPIALNLPDVNRFLNLISKLKVFTRHFPKMYHLSIFIMSADSYDLLFIFHCYPSSKYGNITLQMLRNYLKLSRHQILYKILGKVTKYGVDTCIESRIINIIKKQELWISDQVQSFINQCFKIHHMITMD